MTRPTISSTASGQDAQENVSMTTRKAAALSSEQSPGEAEQEGLLAQGAYFRALSENPGCAMMVADLNGVARAWSTGAERLFGYRADEVLGQSLALLVRDVEPVMAEVPRRLREQGSAECEVRLRRKDGSALDVAMVAGALRDPSGDVTGMVLSMCDVSERVMLERRMQSLGRLQALSRVAAGFAHDLNNILTIVRNYQHFLADSQLSSKQAMDLEVAQDAVARAALLVDRLLTISQDRPSGTVITDLNEVTRKVEEMLSRLLDQNIELLVRTAPQPVLVRAAVGQIDQILLNLLLNARDAMPAGGTLNVSVRNASVGNGHPLHGQLSPGTYAVVSVRDTGNGIDEATLPHIFEPFFTTKPLGEGTGLGLLVVQDIVNQLSGAVRVQSTVGAGTEFEVYLPLDRAPPVVESLPPAESAHEKRTVLVVDEDEAIRSALQRILCARGYSVLLASEAADAIDIAACHPAPIDLLVCDLHPSRGDGRDTYARIRVTRPAVRVSFLCGRPVKAGDMDLDARVIRKPFTPAVVLSTLDELKAAAPALSSGPLPARPVILVVEDELHARESVLRLLSESGLHLLEAKSSLHALQQLESHHVDLVVADHLMPGMDGVQLLTHVRERWPRCQRVLLTAHAGADVVVSAINRGGVSKVLTKQMHPVAIRDEIELAALSAPRFTGLKRSS